MKWTASRFPEFCPRLKIQTIKLIRIARRHEDSIIDNAGQRIDPAGVHVDTGGVDCITASEEHKIISAQFLSSDVSSITKDPSQRLIFG